jgi:AraC-like DNA-binding protein
MRHFKIKSTILPALQALVIVASLYILAFRAASAQPNCISFEAPLAGAVFSTPSCTVSLNVECTGVTRVDLQAQYLPAGSDTAVIVSLGTITRPPYKLIWNTQNLPNQLFTGIGILAEATLSGGRQPQIARQEGIFLTHNPVKRNSIPVPYSPNAASLINNETYAQKFDMGGLQASAAGVIAWNERGLDVYVNVRDPSFHINRSGHNIAEAGLEVLIDPAVKRAPHPADSTMFFVIPLSGAPHSIHYRADIVDGAFKLVPQSSRVSHTHSVGLTEFQGYTVRFSIPREAFGRTMPDTIGANLVLRTLDNEGRVRKVSLAGNNVYEMYSPFSWHEYYRLPKPLLANIVLQWLIFTAAGFLLALCAYAIVAHLRKPQLLSNFERSEEEKRSFDRANNIIECELVRKDLKIEYVANKCGLDPQALNSLIKRNTGFTFINYLQFCRTEIAKERLRSSRASEKSIADMCGFSSAIEMERCFAKFHHTTPYKFRTQQQVA